MITHTARDASTPVDIARALAPRIRARADEIEAARQLPPDLVLDIARAGLFKVALPEAEGGPGPVVVGGDLGQVRGRRQRRHVRTRTGHQGEGQEGDATACGDRSHGRPR